MGSWTRPLPGRTPRATLSARAAATCPRTSSDEQEATARPFLAAAGYCTEQWPLQRGNLDNGAAWSAHVERGAVWSAPRPLPFLVRPCLSIWAHGPDRKFCQVAVFD